MKELLIRISLKKRIDLPINGYNDFYFYVFYR